MLAIAMVISFELILWSVKFLSFYHHNTSSSQHIFWHIQVQVLQIRITVKEKYLLERSILFCLVQLFFFSFFPSFILLLLKIIIIIIFKVLFKWIKHNKIESATPKVFSILQNNSTKNMLYLNLLFYPILFQFFSFSSSSFSS